MKKLLGLLLALAVAFPASADVLKNVDLKGEIQTIASDVHHNPGKVYNAGTNLRVLAGASFDLVEDVRANLLFAYGNTWGQASDGEYGSTLNHYWDSVLLAEANVVLSNLFCCLEATVGRQFYGDEDSAVMYFGPNHYNSEFNGYRALDGVKVAYSDDFKTFTLLAGNIIYDSPTEESEIYGADLKLNLTDSLKWQVYGYDFKDVYGDKNGGFYGTKFTFAPEAVTLAAEYARNFGGDRLVKEHKDTGYLVKADAALNLEAVTPRFAFVYTNGFLGFGNYTPGLLFGDVPVGPGIYVLTRSLRLFNVGVDYNVGKWTFALDGFSFQEREAHHSATLEADLTAKYAHNEYVELFAGVGYAKYGHAKADFGQKDNTKGQLGMLIKF
ncbi:MAG: hypothetical protein E7027_05775 [Elusimicrobium sp.]|uniref:Alginate export domain-containing protein n=1 Tax=Candidatus Avelusimicrobium gallicola TaxID=2562704 RepID=A0A928DPL0_9BACT|nr:hypothetical protein [Elusimicrobium sp.]